MDIFLVPLDTSNQSFEIQLAGRDLVLDCVWNWQAPAWMLSLYDGDTDEPLVMNIPLVAGIDLLGQYKHLGIDGQLFVYTDGDETAPPTLDNLGAESNLYLVTQ